MKQGTNQLQQRNLFRIKLQPLPLNINLNLTSFLKLFICFPPFWPLQFLSFSKIIRNFWGSFLWCSGYPWVPIRPKHVPKPRRGISWWHLGHTPLPNLSSWRKMHHDISHAKNIWATPKRMWYILLSICNYSTKSVYMMCK